MIARKKVVPPVTPRIVQTRPGQRWAGYALLLCAVLLLVWLAYDFGRTGATQPAAVPLAVPAETDTRIAALERERDALRQRVAELEQRARQAVRTPEPAPADAQTPPQTPATPAAPAPAPPSPAAAALPVPRPAAEAVDRGLRLEDVRIERTGNRNRFRIAFTVRRDGDAGDRVAGTLWIAVNGFVDKKPTRLSLKTLSPERRLYVKMGFEQQQQVSEDVVLPADFRPRNVLIEAKPYSDAHTGTSGTFAWDTGA